MSGVERLLKALLLHELVEYKLARVLQDLNRKLSSRLHKSPKKLRFDDDLPPLLPVMLLLPIPGIAECEELAAFPR